MIKFEVLNPCQFAENGKEICTIIYDTRKSVFLTTLFFSDVAVVVCYSSLLSKIHALLGYNLLQH